MEQAESLIEHHLHGYEAAESAAEKCHILREIAAVYERQLGDHDQAFDALFAAFEIDASDDRTVTYMERMAEAAHRWPELIHNVNRMLQAAGEPARRIALALRLAKWYAEDLGHPEHAQPYYQLVLGLDPDNVAVLRQMARYFEKSGQWQQQGQVLTAALQRATSTADREAILADLGRATERARAGRAG